MNQILLYWFVNNFKMENIVEGSGNIPVESGGNKETEYPSLVSRIKAITIDAVIILTVFIIASYLLDMLGEISDGVRAFVLIFMLFLYDPLMTSFSGGTFGHKAVGIRVKDYRTTEQNISFPRALVRSFTKSMLGWISFLTVTGNSEKRAIHDMISASIVLKNN